MQNGTVPDLVNHRFSTAFRNLVKVDASKFTSVDVSCLTEADCRRAMALACKMIDQLTSLAGMTTVTTGVFKEKAEFRHKQLRAWDVEACKYDKEMDQLRTEAAATELRLKQLTVSVNTCAKRLAALCPRKAKNGIFSLIAANAPCGTRLIM